MTKSKLNLSQLKGPFYGVTVNTWGTHDRGGNGLLEQGDVKLFGGNVGHASLSIKLPNNETTRKWVEQYCFNFTFEQFQFEFGDDKTFKDYLDFDNNFDIFNPNAVKMRRVPVTLRTQTTREATLDANGTPVPTSDIAFEQEYLDIEWSWWGAGPQGLEIDMDQAHEGYHVEYADKWKDYLEPEQRRHKGKLGYKDMDYAPSVILHQRDLPDSELERISIPLKILKLTNSINLLQILINKVDDLEDNNLNYTIKLMLKNLGINAQKLSDEANKYSSEQENSSDQVDEASSEQENLTVALFKEYVKIEITNISNALENERENLENSAELFAQKKEALEKRVAKLTEQVQVIKSNQTKLSYVSEEELELLQEFEQASAELSKIEQFSRFYSEHANAYMVVGTHPQHQITLPFGSDGSMGLDPEAMLKAMHLLTDPEQPLFDIVHNNCSLTSIQILEAGAEHNVTLHSILSKKALGTIGTPQQVLGNAQLAKQVIDGNYTPNFITSLLNPKFIDDSFKEGVQLILNNSSTTAEKTKGFLIVLGTGIAKIPSVILQSILEPEKAFNSVIGYVNTVYNRKTNEPWVGNLIKVGVTALAVIPIYLLSPLVLIQKGLKAASQGMQSFINIFKKPSDDIEEINFYEGDKQSGLSNSSLALLNANIKTKINDNTIMIRQQKSPIETIHAFEDALIANPKKIVLLHQGARDSVVEFIRNEGGIDAKRTFYTCCNLSLARVKNYTPKNKQEVRTLLEEINPDHQRKKDTIAEITPNSALEPSDNVEADSPKGSLSF